ncbi:hypothetical protein KC19_6G030500 [Ceratodon purpureus]|uniref:Uncharacterized protein n=1 Tax=Ceratodon purpureus TaxID=3225 RepID=A0A8T0HD45_CERPU|nr:hypothetical protein KC19_6G030500 [Ceratodon purpureus]
MAASMARRTGYAPGTRSADRAQKKTDCAAPLPLPLRKLFTNASSAQMLRNSNRERRCSQSVLRAFPAPATRFTRSPRRACAGFLTIIGALSYTIVTELACC